MTKTNSLSSVGSALRHWRRLYKWTQLDLALAADVSARHISFIETGRAEPTREMLLLLAETMGLLPEQKNSLLSAAGYISDPLSEPVESAEISIIYELMLAVMGRLEPYPAFALNGQLDIVATNRGALLVDLLVPGLLSKQKNIIDLLTSENGLRPFIRNLPEIQAFAVARFGEMAFGTGNQHLQSLLKEMVVEQAPYAKKPVSTSRLSEPTITVSLVIEFLGQTIYLSSLFMMMGTPFDVSEKKLYLLVLVPKDDSSEQILVQAQALMKE